MSDDPTILFGIGAQKSATTWLYEYLRQHPECSLRDIKELNYFNKADYGEYIRRQRWLNAKREGILKAASQASAERQGFYIDRISSFSEWLSVKPGDDAAYIAYLTRRAGGKRLVADITPEYALLSQSTYRRMAGLGVQVKFVFIMRDPVDRLWSSVRMWAKRSVSRNPNGPDFAERARRKLLDVLNGETSEMVGMSDYAGTLQRLFETVPHKSVRVEFYERLFTDDSVRAMTDFLGLTFDPPDFSASHEGTAHPLPPDLADRTREWLDGQYRFVDSFMGNDLPEYWRRPTPLETVPTPAPTPAAG